MVIVVVVCCSFIILVVLSMCGICDRLKLLVLWLVVIVLIMCFLFFSVG